MSSMQKGLLCAVAVVAIVVFVFREQIGLFGNEITSDTQVNWSSCTVKKDAKGAPFSFIRCTEPTMVWMAFREGDYVGAHTVDEHRLRGHAQDFSMELLSAFRESHRLSADMTNTSEEVSLGAERKLWDEVYAQQLTKQKKFGNEGALGNGLLMTRFGDDVYRVLACVSHTDSEILCENAAIDMLYNGMEATIGH